MNFNNQIKEAINKINKLKIYQINTKKIALAIYIIKTYINKIPFNINIYNSFLIVNNNTDIKCKYCDRIAKYIINNKYKCWIHSQQIKL